MDVFRKVGAYLLVIIKNALSGSLWASEGVFLLGVMVIYLLFELVSISVQFLRQRGQNFLWR